MKVLIVDNVIHIRNGISEMIQVHCPFVSELYEAEGVQSALIKIRETNPDVVLLDVELDDGTGMDVLVSLDEIPFHVIFITAFDKYAINAFKFSAIDFLLKPIALEDLLDAFNKVKNQIKKQQLEMQLTIMQENLKNVMVKEKKIALKDHESIYFVTINDIINCQSCGQYTEFTIDGHKNIVISKPLREYEELLTPYGFIRPHHSHLINMRKILRFDRADGGSLIMENQDQIPVSQRKRTKILQFLNSL
ncbi:LytR/AlgR family response regulator transcription factor [Flavivirga spongiicola]|uniref:LytTR family DNA-binding domain-containing protein n=1 Tax=Flavivirga spongiicola TaxID=421621 RepID=A0ABU7XPA8_9FLAO|nr:LytTR family DNA-binding domain-containing protein [Flavivirga sp. MEBiC05379]MDO5981366.1 LytTR family DNA-binding domain-containing protein [Flavivirga sp. MEBiC05379]